ncbi:primosomal protein N' [Neisseria sp.]|uniref:primosomal protein N' n=1 Tax=Neisseria sp. TaxID=192066 RepID=UPI0035A0B211
MIYHTVALNTPLSDGLLTYAHPDALPAGTRVAVPFRNKPVVGVVWANAVTPDIDESKILPVQTAFTGEPPLPESWRALLDFVSRYYHYPLGQAVSAALPLGLKEPKTAAVPQPPLLFRLNGAGKTQEPPPERFHKKYALWQALAVSDGLTLPALKAVNTQAAKLLDEWTAEGWIETRTAGCVAENEARRAESGGQPVPASDRPSETQNGSPSSLPAVQPAANMLNDEQRAASEQIQTAFGTFQTFLLYGITGSGKTEVYFDAMAEVLAQGRQVLFLLPEINLTPQLLKRVEARFAGVPTAVLHSKTAAGKRTQDYLRAMLGQAKLVIGTRLAVFTPLPDAGLIVVDEEHDTSFKQDSELRYHARDLAVWRAKQAGCPIVLGSATPSLESWHKAQTGAYRLLELTRRAHAAAQPPQVEILNVGRLKLDNGFSPQALQLLKKNYEQGGMSLVYLNRRGFAPALFCGDCGHTFGCPRCSAKMVLHRRVRQLRCHHCDFRRPVPFKCPDCGNQDLTAVGQGTQRVEETLLELLPQAKVVRVDRDSTSNKNDWADLYGRIAENGIDVLVGTQMLAKGHDFARLSLVIVLNADGSLYSSDFRAPERLFAELMQVSGRAGRAERAGRVLIQTQLPDHPVFAAVKAQNYRLFADRELAERQMFAMPPCGFQTAVRADAPEMQAAADFLNGVKTAVEPLLPESVSAFGAVPMLMARLAERERAQVFLESASRKDLHRAVSLWVQVLKQNKDAKIRWSVDVDPAEM